MSRYARLLVALLGRVRAAIRIRRKASNLLPKGDSLRLAWQPRELAERLARRARRGQAGGERRVAGASSGGQVVRQRYGEGFYSSIGARGGSTVLEERGVQYLQDIGARGGAVTRQRYGPEHYAEIGRKGGQAGRGRKRPRKTDPRQPGLSLQA